MDGTLEEWQAYWRADDSLLRSEVGLTGATDLAVIEKYRGTCAYWPPHESNPYWSHVNSWWVQYDRFKDEVEGLPEPRRSERFVALSQSLQGEIYDAKLTPETSPRRFAKTFAKSIRFSRTEADLHGREAKTADAKKTLAGGGKIAIIKGPNQSSARSSMDRASVYGTEGYRFDSCRA